DLIGFDFRGRIVDADTGRDIELPAVPWAGHDARFQLPFPERPTPVQAGVVNDMELPLNVEDGQGLAVDLGDQAMTRLHIVDACDTYELPHRFCLLSRCLLIGKRLLNFLEEAFD